MDRETHPAILDSYLQHALSQTGGYLSKANAHGPMLNSAASCLLSFLGRCEHSRIRGKTLRHRECYLACIVPDARTVGFWSATPFDSDDRVV